MRPDVVSAADVRGRASVGETSAVCQWVHWDLRYDAPKVFTHDFDTTHPGEILREEYLEPMGLSASALAIALRVPAPRVNDIVRERRGISPDTALRLARFFGTSAEFWLNLQSGYDLKIAAAANGKRVLKEVQPHPA